MSRDRGHTASRGGFTLIEVSVALLLLSMVLTFVYESFVQTMRTKERVELQAERYQSARIALQRMEREIQSAYLEERVAAGQQNLPPQQQPPPNQNQQQPGLSGRPGLETARKPRTAFVGVNSDAEGYPRDRIDFTTLSHYAVAAAGEDDRQSDHEEVAYFAETDFKVQRTDLMHRADFTMDDDPEGGGDIFPLIEGIRGFNVRYLDPATKNWTESWDSAEKKNLPAAVEIALYMDNPADEKKPLYFSKVVRVPLYSPPALNQVRLSNSTTGGNAYEKVFQDKAKQLGTVLGAGVNEQASEERPRIRTDERRVGGVEAP